MPCGACSRTNNYHAAWVNPDALLMGRNFEDRGRASAAPELNIERAALILGHHAA
jgi:hypothetical protein